MAFVNAASAAAGGTGYISSALMGGKRRTAIAEFTLATDVVGTYTIPIRLPKGAIVEDVVLNSSVSLGTTTVALGITGATGKYRAAAVYTTTDANTSTALNAAVGVALTAAEQLIMTTAVASMPASGRLLVRVNYVDNT